MSPNVPNRQKGGSQRSLSGQIEGNLKVAGALAIVLALVMAVVAIFVRIQAGNAARYTFPMTQYANELDKAMMQAYLGVAEYMLGDTTTLDDANRELGNAELAVRKALQLVHPEDRKDYASIKDLLDKYLKALSGLGGAASAGERDSNFFLVKMYHGQILYLSSRLSDVQWEAMQENNTKATTVMGVIALIFVGVVVATIILGLRINKSTKNAMSTVSNRVRSSSEEIRKRARDSSAASDEMASSSEQVSRAMEEVASSVEQVTLGSGQSAAAAQDIADLNSRIHQMILSISGGAERIMQSIEHFQQSAAATGNAVDQGIIIAEATNQAMASALDAERGSSTGLAKLSAEILRVTEILSSIRSISAQTELLSLNASIEAARAQEHGRGFAVVADEIKKLSSQTALATQEITDIVDHINEVTQQVTAELSQNLASSQTVVQQAATLKDSFDGITHGVKGLVMLLGEIVREAQRQVEQTRESSGLSEKVMISTEQIAAQVEQVSAAMEELSSTVQEVLAASEEMRSNARLQAETSAELHVLADDVAGEMKRLV